MKLYDTGVYLQNGKEIIPAAEAQLPVSREDAARNTIAYSILKAHNTSGNMDKLQIKFDKLTSHDITSVSYTHLTAKMQENAVKAAKALGLTGYSRLDFMMKENGDMYCLEANTLPGMTPTSLIPQEAKVLGMDYPTLCEELIRISLKKYE